MNSDATSRASQNLWLSSHIRVCAVDQHVVLLDLQRNRYLAASLDQWLVISRFIEGSPDLWRPGDGQGAAFDSQNLIAQLLRSGVVCTQPQERQPTASIEDATASLDAQETQTHISIRPRSAARMLTAAMRASWWLRRLSLQSIAHAVAARRPAHLAGGQRAAIDGLQAAVATFDLFRPLAFTARDKCLGDSLTLINFLAKDGMFPKWVIGVKTNPFRAHSWVQSGGLVLNDLHENVRRYRPILVV